MDFLAGKIVLITGGAGTVGRELIRQIMVAGPKELRVIDSNESEVFYLEEEFGRAYRAYSSRYNPTVSQFQAYVGDVRDPDKLNRKMEGVDIVFHTAALKHVVLCERSPFDAVQTNILGVKNVINAAILSNVERVIFTSSDKAVNPTNVMGTTKLMGERLITAANSLKKSRRTIFSSTRFGNVMGSRGSVMHVFYRQIKSGGPVTLTDRNMTRFIMSIEESVNLILSAAELAKGGEVFVTKMPVIRIEDLAHVMCEMLARKFGHSPAAIKFEEIGVKPGEKLYEELMSEEETRRSVELERMFVVLPAFRSVYEEIVYDYPGLISRNVIDAYVSSQVPPWGPGDIRAYLERCGIIDRIEKGAVG